MTVETTASIWEASELPAAPLGKLPPTEKLQSIKSLQGRLKQQRADGCAIVHTHGTFDLLHIGAVRHLEQARQVGRPAGSHDYARRRSAPHGTRPLFNQDLRAEALAALSCVDYVAVARTGLGPDAIQSICPDIYVPWEENDAGDADRRKLRETEAAIVSAVGGRLVALSTGTKTVRLNHHASSALTPEAREFLNAFREHYSQADVAAVLDVARTTSVLYVGETIIDEYQYCESLGKSGKEPVLAVRYVSEEKFAGGVLATANQSAAFCDRIGMLTLLGTKDSHEEFVREKLNPKIDTSFLYMPGARTILKRRMVETYPFQKLFEVYFMDQEVPEAVSKALYARLQALLPRYDAVVVTDYGHGMLTPEIIDLLCGSDRFLAVNTQTNAANQGFNSPSKYARADFLCLSEKELRLEVRNRTKDLRQIVAETAQRLSCKQMLVTRGRSGNLCYHAKEGFVGIPSFTTRIVDRIGAGDALLGRGLALRRQGRPHGNHRLPGQRRGGPGRRNRRQSQRGHARGPGKTNQRHDELRSLHFNTVGWTRYGGTRHAGRKRRPTIIENDNSNGGPAIATCCSRCPRTGPTLQLGHTMSEHNVENPNRGRVFVPGGAGYVGGRAGAQAVGTGLRRHTSWTSIFTANRPWPRSRITPACDSSRATSATRPRSARPSRDATRRSTWPASPTTPAWNSTPISATR